MALSLEVRAEVAPEQLVARLLDAWQQGQLVGLCGVGEREQLAAAMAGCPPLAAPGVVIGSGGSRGGRRWCVQPLSHLQASARATAAWLQALGLDPAACLQLNPLPLQHTSGLLPVLRARQWGGQWRWLAPPLLRAPAELAEAVPLPTDRPVLLSLVPTQLQRLLADPAGRRWLRGMAVIWTGGAPLAPDLAAWARREEIRLSPCYGATETAAMVTALAPERFLAGDGGCGHPLDDVTLRLNPADGAIELRCGRLSPGWLAADGSGLRPFAEPGGEGWWASGDAGQLTAAGLQVLGRLDGAIHSGGETVFPEQVEQRLKALAVAAGLPLAELLLLPVTDPLWGERLVALFRPLPEGAGWGGSDVAGADPPLREGLIALARRLPPAERPLHWWMCASLARTDTGKWQRPRWHEWLRQQREGHLEDL
jgi:o-succinylbenzoate---CoA ligase